ncbi:hypothetical protein KUCAC02_004954 [Chaenocephalus aceratus]|uniref:Uncharacterized protein n=1 Tax=Chaenocephalus aceratus TaxID=36190 RepID=A0ACB9X0Z5_CHAAC|nr:hypothetical protein KUCAC02_004954 [Chaenocephalus aceratus]
MEGADVEERRLAGKERGLYWAQISVQEWGGKAINHSGIYRTMKNTKSGGQTGMDQEDSTISPTLLKTTSMSRVRSMFQ